jgi:lipoate-protein ligase B
MNLSVIDLGLIEYEQAWRLQKKYASEIAAVSLTDLLNEPLETRKVKEEVILAFEEVFGFNYGTSG